MRIGIIAALPGELKPLVRGWQKMPVARGSGIRMWETVRGTDEVVAVCAGMGAAGARRAFTAAEFAGSLDAVVSVGWAGALTETFPPGSGAMPSEVVDAQTGERFALQSGQGYRLVTTADVAGAAEKRRLAASYRAELVDMEAATVARLAQMRGIPVWCLKAVSDGPAMELPDLNRFIDVDGKMKMAQFLGHVALRPGYWGSLLELGRSSAKAAQWLAGAVNVFLLERTAAGKNRGE
jgi:adenosylhomocysteine nucleosidase